MTCPNPYCNTLGIPNEANFCPSCGRQLKPGKFEVVNTQPESAYLFGDNGRLMLDGTIKIDVRQINPPTQGYGTEYFKWDVITGEHKVKAYVAKDEKLEFVFNKRGQLVAINFYPQGKFVYGDDEDAFESIMTVQFGEKRREREGWFSTEYYWQPTVFRAQYAQYGFDNITSNQWWNEHDIKCLSYLKKYKDIVKKHIGISDISNKDWWEDGEVMYSVDRRRE